MSFDLFNKIQGDPWKENIVLSSVPLWKYKDRKPIANASGCLVEYAGSKFLLSIAHATIAASEWSVEVKSVDEFEGKLTTVLQPVTMDFLTEFKLIPEQNDVTEPKIVDFTYKQLPDSFSSTYVIAMIGDQQLIQADRTVFMPDFEVKPNLAETYGFFGYVRFSGISGNLIKFDHRLEDNLTFVGETDSHYIFKLPHKYGSHANYQGCSGAPIIDSQNRMVALVSFGEKSTDSIYGIKVEKYRSILDIDSQGKIEKYGISKTL